MSYHYGPAFWNHPPLSDVSSVIKDLHREILLHAVLAIFRCFTPISIAELINYYFWMQNSVRNKSFFPCLQLVNATFTFKGGYSQTTFFDPEQKIRDSLSRARYRKVDESFAKAAPLRQLDDKTTEVSSFFLCDYPEIARKKLPRQPAETPLLFGCNKRSMPFDRIFKKILTNLGNFLK